MSGYRQCSLGLAEQPISGHCSSETQKTHTAEVHQAHDSTIEAKQLRSCKSNINRQEGMSLFNPERHIDAQSHDCMHRASSPMLWWPKVGAHIACGWSEQHFIPDFKRAAGQNNQARE